MALRLTAAPVLGAWDAAAATAQSKEDGGMNEYDRARGS